MWQNRLNEIQASMEALDREHPNLASVALIFNGTPVIGSHDIRLDFATHALDAYQRIVSIAVAQAMEEDVGRRGPIRGTNQARLYIRDLARGSMGFILEEVSPPQADIFASKLKVAVESTTELIQGLSAANDEGFEEILEDTHPRLVTAIQAFTKTLSDASASARILGDEQQAELSIDDVNRLTGRLNEVSTSEQVEGVLGQVLGVIPDALQCEFRPHADPESVIRCSITEELALKYVMDVDFRNGLLLHQGRAQIRTNRTTRNGRLVRETRVVVAWEPAPEPDRPQNQ
jgi:hypothetical protein